MEFNTDSAESLKKLTAMAGLDVTPPKAPDLSAQRESMKFEREHAKLDTYLNISKRFREVLVWLPIGWLGIVVVVLLAQLFISPAYRLGNTVLVTLLSTTTVNMVGLLYIVAKYLFSDHHHI